MVKQSKVTSKGQVTIPVEIREKLRIKKDSQVIFIANDNAVTLKLVGDFKKYAGFLSGSKIKHITNEEIKDIRTTGKLFSN